MIGVKVHASRVERRLAGLKKGLSVPQVRSTLNGATRSGRAEARKLAGRVLNIRARELYQQASRNTKGDFIRMERAEGTRLKAGLVFSGAPIGLQRFIGGVRRSGKGVMARTWRGQGQEYFHHGFIFREGGPAFRRVHPSPSTKEQRYPIEMLTGPSVADALTPAGAQLEAFTWDAFQKQYLRRIRGALARG